MDIRITRLETLEHAQALARCVYDIYGLTFHRSYLYEPETTLTLNRRGHLASFLALEGDRCVGHLAAIRPYYEYTIAGTPVASDEVREMGLGMVLQHLRGEDIVGRLKSAVSDWAREQQLRGLYQRCVTHQTGGQREVREIGTPTALRLAGVPFWVRYEADGGPRGQQPISTISYYISLREDEPQQVWIPELDSDVFRMIYDRLDQPREILSQKDGPSVGGASNVRVHFDPAKHQGRIHVLRAGPDVAELVSQRFRWLMAGRIRHVMVIAPIDNPFVARAATAWKGEGMIFGGVMPNLMGADAVLYQGVREVDLRPNDIQVIDPLSVRIRNRAIEDWRFTRDMALAENEFDGIAEPSAVL